jgi:hypothetical protein
MDPVAEALKVISEGMLTSDRALLELIQEVIKRVQTLEQKVEMLMELHRLDELTK